MTMTEVTASIMQYAACLQSPGTCIHVFLIVQNQFMSVYVYTNLRASVSVSGVWMQLFCVIARMCARARVCVCVCGCVQRLWRPRCHCQTVWRVHYDRISSLVCPGVDFCHAHTHTHTRFEYVLLSAGRHILNATHKPVH